MINKLKSTKMVFVVAAAFCAILAPGGSAVASPDGVVYVQQELGSQYLPYNNVQGLYLPYN